MDASVTKMAVNALASGGGESTAEEEIANASLARREETLQELQRVQELEAHVVAVLSASQPES